ncbi:glycosyltransferase family 2 protein [Dysgonomonas sp. HDW5A]|uniref:glycosyltransferase family 2 protein n=1 Tax=Dysgonomonas sp. HDW5A TaxID=2714926 RepID=UPI00140C1BB9|nr:glycosyltransferase family 2 protein [Dysgonomonas sp. HDW5A]QIK59619.1 glycosyltransferase family 2 protein [Dysgonomonas sp. HDW5A]
MNNQELISIIVPVYNVEKYLPKCLDSIINQSYQNIEVFLINDGSTDNSLSICEEYKKRDNRITVFSQVNFGIASARNLGLDNARGSFISFIDSDDYVGPDFIYNLYSLLKNTSSDISMCNFLEVKESDVDFTFSQNIPLNIQQYSGCEYLHKLYSKEFAVGKIVVWNKLYSRAIWEDLRFPVGKLNEDEAIIHYVYDRANKIAITSEILYFYVERQGSIMNVRLDMLIERNLYYLEALTQRLDFFELRGYLKLRGETFARRARLVKNIYKNNNKLNNRSPKFDRLVYDDLKGNLKLYLTSKFIKLDLKLNLLYIYMKQRASASSRM